MYFQELIVTLRDYWSKRGCLLLEPYDVELGAGTMAPATFFRALGPEPWRAAYVQPSRRPADARFGENPNRLFQHHQFQVLLKPAPAGAQELYLDSLAALGIDPLRHDLRFVEDDWESPTLGASGLGWEVWCDGMEITQFTYFQQCGSSACKPVSVELTYGLERIAMFLQQKHDVFECEWARGVRYGDVFRQNEAEMSRYALLESDPATLLGCFDAFERECRRVLEAGALALPAYDYALKCSHLFNLLDARGLLSVSERVSFVQRVRDCARACASAYLASRERLGFPLCPPVRASTEAEERAHD